MAHEVLIPITLFAIIFGCVWVINYFNHQRLEAAHKTVRLALERGQDLSPDLIDRLALVSDPVKRDLRRGVLLSSFAAAIALLAFVLPIDDPHGVRGVLGGAVVFGAPGLAYLALWRFSHGGAS